MKQPNLVIRLTVSLLFCVALGVFGVAFASEKFEGEWTFNETLTDKLQPKLKTTKASGRGFQGTLIGGLPLPGSGRGVAEGPISTLKFPTLLECNQFTLEIEDKKIEFSCENGSSREFNVGKLHGRKTKLTKSKITEYYKSTSRSVRHNISVDKEGNLVVTVKIRPSGSTEQTFVRAFSRPAEETETTEDSETQPDVP